MIRRALRHERFYIVSHELIDAGLSAEALGVAVYVLSRPDDWEIFQTQLCTKFKCGKHVMSRILKEIVEAGFAYVEQGRAGSGEFGSNTWVFLESPSTDLPSTVQPSTVNPPLLNKDNTPNKNNIKGKQKERVFKIPTLDLVEAFKVQINAECSPKKFIDYHTSKGWVVGRSPMKDWEAAFRTWEGNHHEFKKEKETNDAKRNSARSPGNKYLDLNAAF